jgi:hypothetical protein
MAHRLRGDRDGAPGRRWRHTPVPDEVVGTRYQWGTAEVEFTFMTTDSDGRAVIPLPDNPVLWSAEPLGNERRELGGVNSRTILLALLRAGKSSAREGSAEGAKDRSDAQALKRTQRKTRTHLRPRSLSVLRTK